MLGVLRWGVSESDVSIVMSRLVSCDSLLRSLSASNLLLEG